MTEILINDQVKTWLAEGAAVVLSVSGGKDSDAMSYAVLDYLKANGCTNAVYLVHADLGRAEWKATPAYVAELGARLGLPVVVVRHPKRDLVDGIRYRMAQRPGVPPWPSPSLRQCTSDWKRDPIDKWIRNTFKGGKVIVCMGLRAEESARRAKKAISEPRLKASSAERPVINWHPVHALELADVWATIGERPRHPAYALGNERLSCALCILASENDLLNGALQDPWLFQEFCAIEIESGFSFRDGFWLGLLSPELLRPDQVGFYADKKQGRSVKASVSKQGAALPCAA